MNREDVLNELRAILIESLDVRRPPEEIDPDVPLFGTGLALDSVDAVELVVAIETRLGVSMPDNAGRSLMRTLATLADYVVAAQRGEWSPGVALEVPNAADLSGADAEIVTLRTSVGIHRADHVVCLRVSGGDAFDALDRVASCDLTLRDRRMRPCLFLDGSGLPFADVQIGREDADFLVLAEGPSQAELCAYLADAARGDVTIEVLTDARALLSLHGPYAWELLGDELGPDIIGLPYLTFVDLDVTCFRTGKTGEYGYDLLVPRERAEGLFTRLCERGKSYDARVVGLEALDRCALENGFFNIRAEGRCGLDPITLGLQWRLSSEKEYLGSSALRALRAKGIGRRVACLVASTPFQGKGVRREGAEVGEVVARGWSPLRREHVALSALAIEHAEPGLEGFSIEGAPARSVSLPLIDNRSLYVDPQHDSYRTRHEEPLPPLVRA